MISLIKTEYRHIKMVSGKKSERKYCKMKIFVHILSK